MKIDTTEALRYAGVPAPDEGMLQAMEAIADRLAVLYTPRTVWRMFSVQSVPDGMLLAECGLVLRGSTARRMLETCSSAAVIACTIGPEFDLMLRRLQLTDMSEAVMTDACGSAYVEAVCNDVEEEIRQAKPDMYLSDRFSPGYGDLPLDIQKELLAAVNAQRRTGITLTESDLMNPVKSVTAIIGLSDRPQQARIRGCGYCRMAATCALRKKGKNCGT